MREWRLASVVLAIATASTGALCAQERPNILFVTFDTTQAERLSPYGNTKVRTPSLQKLADHGVVFENAYAQAPQTLPNHASIFTGLYTITHNVMSNGQKLDDQALTLAEVLTSYGYNTGAFVSATPLLDIFNLDQGFAHYNSDFTRSGFVDGFTSVLRLFSANKVNVPSQRPAHETAQLAMDWMNEAAGSKEPFFLWVHFFDPHEPYEFRPEFHNPHVVHLLEDFNEYGERESSYENEIEFADYNLGKLLTHLDNLGLADKTLTVVTADHGESLGEHNYVGHRQNLYENIIRVPLILHWPQHLPASRRIAAPAMSVDIMPTLLSLLGIPHLPGSFQGQDLFAESQHQPRKVYSVAVKLFSKSPIRRAMILGDYKFVEHDDPKDNALYDLRNDPQELHNLVDNMPSEARKTEWVKEIHRWWEAHADLRLSDFKMTPDQLERLKSLGYVN